MRTKVFIACLVAIWISFIITSCSTGVSQEEYDKIRSDLAQARQELTEARASLSEAEITLSETERMLAQAQEELDAIKANPPVLEVDFVDIGKMARLTTLKLTKGPGANDTYVVVCQLELVGDLPGLVNVVDVELLIRDAFVDSDRWIDVSSTGFITQKPRIILDTGLHELSKSMKLKIVPAFKVFGT